MEKRIRVGVLLGGKSDEHDVSVMSAVSVMKHLDPRRFQIRPVGISRQGHWIELTEPYAALGEAFLEEGRLTALVAQADAATTELALTCLRRDMDVVFPVLHGPFGEDGTVQGLCEMLDVPYVGARVTASALCMDKGHTKRILRDAGVPVVPWAELLRPEYLGDPQGAIQAVETRLSYPLFVKPANLGSSVGISKAKDQAELAAAIETAFRYDKKILVEQGIDCRELECAVLGNEAPEASCVGEIIPAHEFYDYEAKYFCDGQSKILIPAPVDSAVSETIRRYALEAYRLLGITGLSRVDFFQDRASGAILLNEINTMPGFTKFSMYPMMWTESGLTYGALLERLIALALEDRGAV